MCLKGEMSPVLADGKVRKVPVFCRRPNGRVQHATVHSTRVQGHRR